MATMGIVLDELIKARLHKLAEQADRSMSAQIRYLINREYERLYGDEEASSKDDPGESQLPPTGKMGARMAPLFPSA